MPSGMGFFTIEDKDNDDEEVEVADTTTASTLWSKKHGSIPPQTTPPPAPLRLPLLPPPQPNRMNSSNVNPLPPQPSMFHPDFPVNMAYTWMLCGQCWCTGLVDETRVDPLECVCAWFCCLGGVAAVYDDVVLGNYRKPIKEAWGGQARPCCVKEQLTCCDPRSGRRPGGRSRSPGAT